MKNGQLLNMNKQFIIREKDIQKAYFLDKNFDKELEEKNKQNGLSKNVLSVDFCKVIGKILTFVEEADQ
ncbi:hypothetical protein FQB35_02485 [Crassaminicella thermophila]|uniref:Uncharacterized protein n=1 Tax=Crassaminicella thermophila TaxID=2599308 RepID=A0A5C0SC96_CRATE|nr:hypothetical protein [Crassaminicella thermophila]QEK11326.1 hypothetical protein FQB35_02485 [Crassaminicella thermophila]